MSEKQLTMRQLRMLFLIEDGQSEQAYDWDGYEQDRQHLLDLGLVMEAKSRGWWVATHAGVMYLGRCCKLDAEQPVGELDELVTRAEFARLEQHVVKANNQVRLDTANNSEFANRLSAHITTLEERLSGAGNGLVELGRRLDELGEAVDAHSASITTLEEGDGRLIEGHFDLLRERIAKLESAQVGAGYCENLMDLFTELSNRLESVTNQLLKDVATLKLVVGSLQDDMNEDILGNAALTPAFTGLRERVAKLEEQLRRKEEWSDWIKTQAPPSPPILQKPNSGSPQPPHTISTIDVDKLTHARDVLQAVLDKLR